MAPKNLFSTERKTNLTGSQMLENVIKQRNAQRENMIALTEARKLSSSTPDITGIMESTNLEVDRKLRTDAILEQAQYRQGTINIARRQLQMQQRLLTEGMDYVRNKVLGELIYESYWLDEPVRESTVNQISDSIGKVLEYVEENFNASKVPESKQSKLIQNVNEVIESVVKEAVDRLVTEARESNAAFTEFELSDKEEDELDDKLSELGRDEIVEVIKNKVAQVVQDEKEKGIEKSEMFNEIEQATQQTDDADGGSVDEGETSTTEESSIGGVTLKEALSVTSNEKLSAGEKYIVNIMESGTSYNAYEDPTWGEFKNYTSMMSKKIRDTLINGKFDEAITLIDDFMRCLSGIPENTPTEIKEFILAITNLIYGAVPADEVIISRFGGSGMGSPGLSSAVYNVSSISMDDVLVNIKTNLSSIKDYCIEKSSPEVIDDTTVKTSMCHASTGDALACLVATKQNQLMTQNIAGSIFEALMISNISETSKIVEESSNPVSDEDVEDAALIESLLQYTILETLDTLGIYKFKLADINSMKRTCVTNISEGTNPLCEETGSGVMGAGNDKSGKKIVRINTKKMKRKRVGVSQN